MDYSYYCKWHKCFCNYYGLLNTKNIIIWNEDQQRFLWNGEGLFAYGENESGEMDFNTFVRLNDQGLLFQRLLDAGTENEYTETPLSLTWSGLNISGQKGAININSTYGLQVFDDQACSTRENSNWKTV